MLTILVVVAASCVCGLVVGLLVPQFRIVSTVAGAVLVFMLSGIVWWILIYAGVLKMRPDLFVMFVPPLVLSVVFGILFARWTRPGVD